MSSELKTVSPKFVSTEIFDSDKDWGHWRASLKDVVKYRFLLQNLVVRDLKARYKDSILGVLWSLLNPLFMMLVYTILFTKLMPNNTRVHYPVFILVALIPWNFLTGSLTSGTAAIMGNAHLIKKVYFPRILLPLSAVFSNLVNFLLAFLILLVFLFASGIGLTIHALWVPVILLIQIIFLMGLSMLLSALQAFYRDVMMILNVGLLAWFFLTPIFYSFENLEGAQPIMGFEAAVVMRWVNPMASIIDGYRTVLWGSGHGTHYSGPGPMDVAYLLRTFITAVVVFLIGYFVFNRLEHYFGEKL